MATNQVVLDPPEWAPQGWIATQKGPVHFVRHPDSGMDVSHLSEDFFVNASPELRAMELLWLNACANLRYTENEIWIPTNIVDLHGYDPIIPPLVHRLGVVLSSPVNCFIDESMKAFRIRPVKANETEMPINEFQWSQLAELVHRAIHEDHLNVSIESPRVPRPPNSFILYRQHHHHAITEANPGVPNTEISRIIADMWRNETAEVRARFKELADDARRRHAVEHPNYHYQPRRGAPRPRRRVRAPVGLLSFLNQSPVGQSRLEEAARNNDPEIDIDEDLIAIFDVYGMAYGPNGLLPPQFDAPLNDRHDQIVKEQLELKYLETVNWVPTTGSEFDDDFNWEGLLNAEGA